MLKTALFTKVQESEIAFPGIAPADFPLSRATGDRPIAYRSAIARKVAATNLVDVNFLTRFMVEQMAVPQSGTLGGTPGQINAILENCHVKADTQGWITLSLTDQGITAWLQHLNEVLNDLPASLLLAATAPHPLSPSELAQLPLCKQLNLSLPMVLQFGYACCCRWLRHCSALGLTASTSLVVPGSPSEGSWQWSSQSPLPCRILLQAIAQTLDTMTDQQGDRTTCLRQGHALVAALYNFQSAFGVGLLPDVAPASQTSICSTLRAAQQVLALIIASSLHQSPTANF